MKSLTCLMFAATVVLTSPVSARNATADMTWRERRDQANEGYCYGQTQSEVQRETERSGNAQRDGRAKPTERELSWLLTECPTWVQAAR